MKKTMLLSVLLSLYAMPSYADNEEVLAPFEAIGTSGYVRNRITGETKVGDPALAKLNNQLKKSWASMGYKCKIDCSGHQAGYNWAKDNAIRSRSDCEGSSKSFIEGCYAYVRFGRPNLND